MLFSKIILLVLNIGLIVTHLDRTVSAEEKHIVPLDQIVSGGPPPDGIPSIDSPKFVSVYERVVYHYASLVLGKL